MDNVHSPLTTEELRNMNGEPVWVEFQDGTGMWGLVHLNIFHKIVFADWSSLDINGLFYGKHWTAYRYKQEANNVQ